MRIEYIRNAQYGYMRVEMTEPLNKIEEEMLERNRPEGILPVCWQREDGKYLLRYDITGKQALDVLLENRMADEIILKSLLVGICVAVKQLEKYLLWQEGLMLTPETIFWDGKSETMHFCYYPVMEESLQTRLVHLMEYVLAKTDHKNVLAVQLVYGIYEEVQKATFSINDLQGYLSMIRLSEREEEPNCRREIEEESMDVQVIENGACQVEKDNGVVRLEKINVIEVIMGWIKKKIIRLSREKQEEKNEIIEIEEDLEDWAATRVLNFSEDELKGILRYDGENFQQDIHVSKVPFIIGSMEGCDGLICAPTISRNHAKILMNEGEYFIEDLNSTNGTKVNDALLSYKTKVSLKKNDRICFANEPYRFL